MKNLSKAQFGFCLLGGLSVLFCVGLFYVLSKAIENEHEVAFSNGYKKYCVERSGQSFCGVKSPDGEFIISPIPGVDFHLHESGQFFYSTPIGEESKNYYTLKGVDLGKVMNLHPEQMEYFNAFGENCGRLYFRGLTPEGKHFFYYPKRDSFREYLFKCDYYCFESDCFLFYQDGETMTFSLGPAIHDPYEDQVSYDVEGNRLTWLVTFEDGTEPILVLDEGSFVVTEVIFPQKTALYIVSKCIDKTDWEKIKERGKILPTIGALRRLKLPKLFYKDNI